MKSTLPFQKIYDLDSDACVSALDDLCLWSAPFGMQLLETIRYRPKIRALDVACGSGFPTLEVAQRLGASSHAIGIDIWPRALRRAKAKQRLWRLGQLDFSAVDAEHLPFAADLFDLIISNNGINNVENDAQLLRELARVARAGCQAVFTVNLPDSFHEFYSVYIDVLRQRHLKDAEHRLVEHIHAKRKPRGYTETLLSSAGFEIRSVHEDRFTWRFSDARGFFEHSFIQLAFAESWYAVLESDHNEIFHEIAARLDENAGPNNIVMTIPWICIDAVFHG